MEEDKLLQEAENRANKHEFLEEELTESTSKRNIPTILAVIIVISGFSTLMWYAYNSNSKPKQEGDLPIIKSENNTIKIKPSDPGGMVVPNMDKSVYDNLSPSRPEKLPKVERILPPAEEPLDRQKILENKKEEVLTQNKEVTKDVTPAPHRKEDTPPSAVVENIKPVEDSNKDEPKVTSPDKEITFDQNNAKDKAEIIKPLPKDQKKSKLADSNFDNKSKFKGYKIQLAAFKTKKEADIEWAKIKKQNSDIFGNVQPFVERKDLGSKGVFYRLQAGPFKSNSEARLACKKLVDRKQNCFVVQ